MEPIDVDELLLGIYMGTDYVSADDQAVYDWEQEHGHWTNYSSGEYGEGKTFRDLYEEYAYAIVDQYGSGNEEEMLQFMMDEFDAFEGNPEEFLESDIYNNIPSDMSYYKDMLRSDLLNWDLYEAYSDFDTDYEGWRNEYARYVQPYDFSREDKIKHVAEIDKSQYLDEYQDTQQVLSSKLGKLNLTHGKGQNLMAGIGDTLDYKIQKRDLERDIGISDQRKAYNRNFYNQMINLANLMPGMLDPDYDEDEFSSTPNIDEIRDEFSLGE